MSELHSFMSWGLKIIQEYENSFDLMQSFDILYYLNGRFPYNIGFSLGS